MEQDKTGPWVANAKAGETPRGKKQPQQSRGVMIMELAEKLFPAFQNFFRDKRDENGVCIQPAHVRGFALNYAEYLVKHTDNPATA